MATCTEPDVAVLPLVLAWTAGLPADVLDPLRFPSTRRVVRQCDEIDRKLAGVAPALERGLYELVPQLDHDQGLRRAVLTLKRDVHNCRTVRVGRDVLDAVAGLLPAPGADLLDAFLDLAERHGELQRVGDEVLRREVGVAARALVATATRPEILDGLVVASPSLVGDLLDVRIDPARLTRSLTSYVARIALKPSPFSTFATVGLAGPRAPRSGHPRRLGVLTRAVSFELLRRVALDRRFSRQLDYEVSPAVDGADGQRFVLLADTTAFAGFLWKHDRLVGVETLPAPARVLLTSGPRRFGRDELALLLGEDVGLFDRLVLIGLIRPVAPWSRTEAHPLEQLAATIEGAADPAGAILSQGLRAVEATTRDLVERQGVQRLADVATVRSDIEASFHRLPPSEGAAVPAWFERVDLLHEDATSAVPAGSDDGRLRQAGDAVAKEVRPEIVRSRVHDVLVDEILRGGLPPHGRPALTVIVGLLRDPAASRRLRTAMLADDGLAAVEPVPEPDRDAAGQLAPAATVMFQLLDERVDDRGDAAPLAVVNQVLGGSGGLLARWLPSLDPAVSSVARAHLSDWIRSLCPGGEPHEVALASDWNSIQQLGVGVLPPLRWPTETPTIEDEATTGVHQLRVRHDVAGGIHLATPDGSVVTPVYLGMVPPILMSWPARLLFRMVDPWLVRSELDRRPWTRQGIEHHPRVTSGRVVRRRAVWRVPVSSIPDCEPGESAFRFLTRFDRWRRLAGLPEEVFARAEPPDRTAPTRPRKPLWIDLTTPFGLEALQHLMAAGNVAVLMAEALPARGDHTLVGADGRRRAVEHVAFVRSVEEGVR